MNIGENIKTKRIEKGLTLEKLANAVGTSKQTIQRYESGVISNIPSDKIEAIANALNTSPAYIMGWEENNTKIKSPEVTEDYVTFPVIGEIAAGYNEIAFEDWGGETVDIPTSYLKGRTRAEFIVLKVNGDSMYPQYQNGDKVLILKQSTLNRSGDIGAVIYDDECATLKKIEYVNGEDWMKLIPINPEFKPKYIENEELEHCKIIGIPKLLIREID